ncbi:alpha/beta hydrolase family protein [Persephonella sp.]
MLKKFFVLLISVVFVYSCSNDSPTDQTTSTLIEAQAVVKLSSSDVAQILLSAQQVSATAVTTQPFGMLAYRVVYWTTDENGNRVKASGLVVFPDVESLDPAVKQYFTAPLVSDQHGTIFTDAEAPTNEFQHTVYELIRAKKDPTYSPQVSTTFKLSVQYTGVLGFVLAMPDYIGYGESVDHYHTYMLENSLANATVDLIYAVKELAERINFPLRKEVYLAGYSEGGYATMAAAKKLQSEKSGFTVKAVFPMAGVYDLETLGLGLLSQSSLGFPPFPAYVVYAYSEAYSDVSLQGLVQPDFVEKLPVYFDKTKTGLEIFADMCITAGKDPANCTFTPDNLFTDEAVSQFLTDTEYPFRKALRMNNVDDWVPQMKMVFIHCGGDNILPQSLAYDTYTKFAGAGAPAVDFVDPEVVFETGSLSHTDCAPEAYKVLFGYLCQLEYGAVCGF